MAKLAIIANRSASHRSPTSPTGLLLPAEKFFQFGQRLVRRLLGQEVPTHRFTAHVARDSVQSPIVEQPATPFVAPQRQYRTLDAQCASAASSARSNVAAAR